MAKLQSIMRGGYRITQSPHGKSQNYKAMDFVSPTGSYDIIAPCPVKIERQLYDSLGNPFFYMFNNNWKIQVAHGLLTVQPGLYKTGVKVGGYRVPQPIDKLPDHGHITIYIANIGWQYLLDYTDRSIPLSLGSGFQSQHWKDWSTWADRQLNIDPLFPPEPPKPPVDTCETKLAEALKTIEAQKAIIADYTTRLNDINLRSKI